MLSNKQAEAASDALLHPQQEYLQQRVTETSRVKRISATSAKGAAIGTLVGGVMGFAAWLLMGSPYLMLVAPPLGMCLGGALGRSKAQPALPADAPSARR